MRINKLFEVISKSNERDVDKKTVYKIIRFILQNKQQYGIENDVLSLFSNLDYIEIYLDSKFDNVRYFLNIIFKQPAVISYMSKFVQTINEVKVEDESEEDTESDEDEDEDTDEDEDEDTDEDTDEDEDSDYDKKKNCKKKECAKSKECQKMPVINIDVNIPNKWVYTYLVLTNTVTVGIVSYILFLVHH